MVAFRCCFRPLGGSAGDRYSSGGKSYPMRQHGLARHAAWEVVDVQLAKVTMEFRSTPMSRVNFPFDFVLRMVVDLGRAGYRTLAIDVTVENTGPEPMPVHFGLHPYFLVSDKDRDRIRVEVDANYAFDNNSGETGPWNRELDLTVPGVDLHADRFAVTDGAFASAGENAATDRDVRIFYDGGAVAKRHAGLPVRRAMERTAMRSTPAFVCARSNRAIPSSARLRSACNP